MSDELEGFHWLQTLLWIVVWQMSDKQSSNHSSPDLLVILNLQHIEAVYSQRGFCFHFFSSKYALNKNITIWYLDLSLLQINLLILNIALGLNDRFLQNYKANAKFKIIFKFCVLLAFRKCILCWGNKLIRGVMNFLKNLLDCVWGILKWNRWSWCFWSWSFVEVIRNIVK